MDVSGTDPRTRTGLFLWPWASYPGVAANAASGQQIMMGAGGPVGANMLGVPNTGSGPLNVPAMMEDSIESFYQRFSYPGSHAAQMSHLLPQHGQPGNEARHVSREMHTTPSSSSRSRTQTPQSRSGHLHRTSNDPSSHAAAIAAFASVAANSGVIGDSPHHSSLVLPHGMHSSRHLQQQQQQQHSSREMTLDNLCNGMNSPNIAIPPSKTEGVSNYGLRNVHQINSAALALADLCSGSDKSMDDAGSTRNNSGTGNNNSADDMRGSASTADGYSQHHHYAFSGSKSPMSENQDHRSADSVHEISRMSMDLVRNGRLMPDLRDAFLLRNQNSMRDCSPDDRPSSEYHARPREEHAGPMAHDVANSTNECSAPGGSNSFTHAAKGYKCKICQHVCFSRHDLSAHNAATHKQDPRPYRCEQCGRQFSTGAYLSQHRRIHTGVKPYACRHCGRRFTQLSHVQQHERIHTGEKPYKCTTCLKSFTQMSNLQSHQRQHMKGKPHRCEQCFMSFDSKDELDVHVQAKHSGNRYAKVLVCPICQKSYNSETYLAKHMDRHKEAAAASSTVPNDSLVNAASVNCMDDLFGFSTHPVAMAARLSHHQHPHHQPPQQHRPTAASSAAAAAVAAAHARVAADQLTSYIGDEFLHNLHAPFSKLSQLSNPFQETRPHQTFGAYSAAPKRDPNEAGEQQLLNLTQQQTPRRLPPPAHQQCPPETGSRNTSPRQQPQPQFMLHAPALSPPQVSPRRHLSGASQEEANQGTLDFLLDTSKTHAPAKATATGEKSVDEGTPLSTPGRDTAADTAAIASSVANELAKMLPMRSKQDDLYARDSGSGELMDDEEDEEDGTNSRGLGIDTLLDEEDNGTGQTRATIFPINETRDAKMAEAGCMFNLTSEMCDRLTKGQWSGQSHLMNPKIASDDDDDDDDEEEEEEDVYGNKQRANADAADKQTKAMNVPFYLGSPWRQYQMSKEAEPHSEETKTEGSSKRRRRHHYVPQHLPNIDHPIVSEGCYYGTQHYRATTNTTNTAATPAEVPVPSSTPSTSSSQDKQHLGSMCNFPSFQF